MPYEGQLLSTWHSRDPLVPCRSAHLARRIPLFLSQDLKDEEMWVTDFSMFAESQAIFLTKQQLKIASDSEGKVVMKEGKCIPFSENQKAFERRRKMPQIQLPSGLRQIFLCSVMPTTQLPLCSWALTPVIKSGLFSFAISIFRWILLFNKTLFGSL